MVREFPGIIEAIESVDCVARVQGFQQKTLFKEGAMVKKGDLLFEIEDTTYRAALDSLLAKRDQLQQTLNLSTLEYERSKSLRAKEIVTASAHDAATCAYETAQAAVREISANIKDSENNLSYTKIYAPISGRIGKASFSDGNLVSQSSGTLVNIEQIAPIYARFALSERVFRKDFGGIDGIAKNAVIQLRLADGTVYGETAAVTLIDNKVTATTNTIQMWATFKNEDMSLMPGSYVTVLISKAGKQNPVAIVPTALVLTDDGYVVYVVGKDHAVAVRKVTPGPQVGEHQVILQGLVEGETVVVAGMNKVRPGMTVAPVAFKKAESGK